MNWSVAVPVAAAVIAAMAAVWGAWMTYKAQAANRALSREMKIAEFRQAWLNHLRSNIAEQLAMLSTAARCENREQRNRELYNVAKCAIETQLLLGPHDPNYAELSEELQKLTRLLAADEAGFSTDRAVEISQGILKRGWDGLRRDLRQNVNKL